VPPLMKRLRDAETDARARTRDEDRVVFEVEHEVLSVHDEHGLAGKPAGHQILRDLPDLFPRPLEADVRRELAGGDQIGETTQTNGRGLADEFREEIKTIERCAPADEEPACVERDLG